MTPTPEQARHAAAMYAALADGKECQRQAIGTATWYPWYGDTIQLDRYTYRAKPEPEPEPVVNEWWFNVYPDSMGGLHTTPEAARKWAGKNALETAVHIVRADSIKIAELVTDEQIDKAQWTVRWGTPCDTLLPSLIKFVYALDAVREQK